jgi:microcystin degradation protein MlrC
LLKEIRKIVSKDCLIALSLAAHANITDELCDYADIISGFETVPHIDQVETQLRSANTLVYCLKNNIKPCAKMVRVPFLLKNDTLQTAYEPLKGLIEETLGLEKTDEIFTAISLSKIIKFYYLHLVCCLLKKGLELKNPKPYFLFKYAF